MPTRMIREGLLDSEKVDLLSAEAERFYVRLMLVADDFGRFSADLRILKSRCFPLRESMSKDEVEKQLMECVAAGLVTLYAVEGKSYLEILNFCQRMRSKHSKYPPPRIESASNMTDTCQSYAGQVLACDNIKPPSTPLNVSVLSEVEEKRNGNGSAPAFSLADSPIEWLSKLLSDRHPKKGDRNIVPAAIIDQLGPMSDDEQWARAKQIDKTHAAWCRTSGWTKQNGTYAPKLTNWLREGGWRDEPPLIVDSGDMPDTDVYDKGWREERGV